MSRKTYKTELSKLLRKYLMGKTSKEESAFVEKYYEYFENEADFTGNLSEREHDQLGKEMLQVAWERAKPARSPIRLHFRSWAQIAATIAVVLVLGSGLFYISRNLLHQEPIAEKTPSPLPAIPPGGNKAILTLTDNSTVILDSAQNGLITNQGNTQIVKLTDGQLVYESGNGKEQEQRYNTITTPVGGQYQLTLSDGTKVWLNAASSIRFPVAFTGKTRKVFITGEVYFEVNPVLSQTSAIKVNQGNLPFLVDIAGKGLVTVLGTHFNISSYSDEQIIRTTLLEGKISFTPVEAGTNTKPVTINPGQQIQLHPDGLVQVEEQVNLEKVVAWKNGYFYFSSSSLQEVMNQIARWYSVEVVFEGEISSEKFSGKIQRDLNLSEALKILEVNKINFRMEGNRMVVGN